jgi:hypothetical protein
MVPPCLPAQRLALRSGVVLSDFSARHFDRERFLREDAALSNNSTKSGVSAWLRPCEKIPNSIPVRVGKVLDRQRDVRFGEKRLTASAANSNCP